MKSISREDMKQLFAEYIKSGHKVSPMNTEGCRKYLQGQTGVDVSNEDVLWLYYNTYYSTGLNRYSLYKK